jgi:hypothetical protein
VFRSRDDEHVSPVGCGLRHLYRANVGAEVDEDQAENEMARLRIVIIANNFLFLGGDSEPGGTRLIHPPGH